MLYSVRTRLTLWYSAMLTVTLLGFTGLWYLTLSSALHRQIDRATQMEAEEIRTKIGRELGTSRSLEQVAPQIRQHVAEEEMFVQILSADGTVVLSSANLGRSQAALAVPSGTVPSSVTTQLSPNRPIRAHISPVFAGDHPIGYVLVGASIQGVKANIASLARLAAISLPVAVLFAVIVGWLLAVKALAPVDAITRTAEEVSVAHLSKRLPEGPMPLELRRLAATFNAMLDRLELAFHRQRRLVADASHQLRTPLAVMRGHIDVALAQEQTKEDYRLALDIVGKECDALTDMTNAMLTLARADVGGLELRRERVELDGLVESVYGQGRAMAEGRRIHLTRVVPLVVHGDRDLLHQALLNLVDNAVRHTSPDDRIEIFLAEEAGWANIGVRDSGRGIALKDRPWIFERFYRGGGAQDYTGGAGLGLAITAEIVKAHQGRIDVTSEPGKGSTFVIRLPLST